MKKFTLHPSPFTLQWSMVKVQWSIVLTLLLGIAQGAWADTGRWQDNRDSSWGGNYDTSDAFTISTAAELAQLACMVTYDRKSFKSKTITLAADIDLSAHYWNPIGVDVEEQFFSGIFDGAGHTISGMNIINDEYLYTNDLIDDYKGLFGYIDDGARIKNLKITNSWINTVSNITGAIVGYARNCIIENCSVDSSVEITSNATQPEGHSVDIATGGLVGRLGSEYSELWGCVCAAKVIGREKVGGLVGEVESAKVVACLYTGSNVTGGSSTTQAALFGNINGECHLYYNLYTNSALDGKNGQDRRGYVISFPSSEVTFDFGTPANTYNVSSITYYAFHNYPYANYFIITYNGTMYCEANERIPFTVSAPLGYVPSTVTASAGTLTQEGRIYSLLTAASDCTLSATTVLTAWGGDGTGTQLDPYHVKTPDDLRWIAAYLNAATNDHYNNKYFQLDNNIDFDGTLNNFTAIGGSTGTTKYFAGNFDGHGHTISGININANGLQGLFSVVNGATIQNLKLSASSITCTSGSGAGGIVGYAGNNGVTIENCHVSESVTIESGSNCGGIIGNTNAGEVNIT